MSCFAGGCTVDGIPLTEWIRVPVVDDSGKHLPDEEEPSMPGGGEPEPESDRPEGKSGRWSLMGGDAAADPLAPAGRSYATDKEYFAALDAYNAAKEKTYTKNAGARRRQAEKDGSSAASGRRQSARGLKPGLKTFKLQPDGSVIPKTV